MQSFSSALATEGAGDMAWEIGDHGFDIRLSTYVPGIIAGNIKSIVQNILEPSPWSLADIGTWAVHPGGRSIVDKVETALELGAEKLHDSREVLRNYGNMSSVTVLFVLERILNRPGLDAPQPVCAMAFGPGLTIETALLIAKPAASPRRETEPISHAEVLHA